MVLVGTPENPVPAGAAAGYLRLPEGPRLRHARWPASGAGGRGTVCIFQGRAECIEKYFETVEDLRRRGFAVASLDWRGQGGSDRLLKDSVRGHIDSFSQYLRDLAAFMQEIVLPECPAPYYALAHSMGGAVLLLANRRRPSLFERMVLTAPMLRIGLMPFPPATVKSVCEVLGLLSLGERPVGLVPRRAREDVTFEKNCITSDRRRFERNQAIFAAAPALSVGQPTYGWLHAALTATDEIAAEGFAEKMQAPILMLAAGHEEIVSTPAIERLSRRLRAGSHIIIPGARHELLMESDRVREQVWAAFDAFVPGSAELFPRSLAGLG